MNSNNKLSDHWKSIADVWRNLTSPSRPSTGEVEIYQKHLDAMPGTNLKVLILGATPELRDLVLSNVKVKNCVAVDVNMEMILAMNELVKENTANEIWVKSSWLEAPLCESYFDLILADFTFENMSFDNHSIYFQNVRRWLKSEGLYIGRVATFRSKYAALSIEEIEKLCSNKDINNELLSLFWDIAVFFTGSMTTREVKVADFFAKLELYKLKVGNDYNNTSIKKILDINENVFPHGKSWFVWNDEDFKGFVQNLGFKILSQECSADINMPDDLKDMAPIYCLQNIKSPSTNPLTPASA